MADASFDTSYSNTGTGYMHYYSQGGFLQPGDFHGLSTLLVRNGEDAPRDCERLHAALGLPGIFTGTLSNLSEIGSPRTWHTAWGLHAGRGASSDFAAKSPPGRFTRDGLLRLV
jgi:hypothetical protein